MINFTKTVIAITFCHLASKKYQKNFATLLNAKNILARIEDCDLSSSDYKLKIDLILSIASSQLKQDPARPFHFNYSNSKLIEIFK